MAVSVLITQCLQNDFVKPIEAHEPLPNKLHVGREEATRLMGVDPSAGPVAQLMSWAREQAPETLHVLHIRDWHDPADPRQTDHLAMFGAHCVKGTQGAKLVLDLDDEVGSRRNEQLVDAIALNDFEDTALPGIIARIQAEAGGEPLRVGVVGCWTEAKVSFLLYDLKTRCRIDEIATCSALDASASRLQHFNALEQLQKILGAQVFDSVGDFVAWLLPTGTAPRPPSFKRFGPNLDIQAKETAELTDEDRDILGYLYRDSTRVTLAPLGGGFSGAKVFRVKSWDAAHEQAPSVAKLGPRNMIGAERASFERVEAVLGNNAPSVRGFVDLGSRAGIKYSFASMGGQVRTFKSLYEGGAETAKIDGILKTVFDEVLGRLYAGSQYERLSLLDHYRFAPGLGKHVRPNVEKILGAAASAGDRLLFPGGFEACNLTGFYETFLAEAQAVPANEYHYVSYVHGDLNGANILVDGRENVWVIDFFHTAPGHVLKDLAKLENDLLYIYTPVTDEGRSFEQALAITKALRRVEDLAAPLPEKCEGLTDEPFLRAWSTLRTLRGIAGRLCREDRDPMQMRIALLRYSAHTLAFDESSPLQKKWALAASCVHAEDVVLATHANRKLRVDWVEDGALPTKGRLGMTLCPGRRDRGRSLDEDLDVLRAGGVSRLLCLATDSELEWAGVSGIEKGCVKRGIQFLKLPVKDQSVPSFEDQNLMVRWMSSALDAGQNVVLHCMGGLGRTGTVAACLLVARGLRADDAVAAVRRARGPRAIEIADQARFVADYASSRPWVADLAR